MAAPKLLLSGICRVESNKRQQNGEESTAMQAQLFFFFFFEWGAYIKQFCPARNQFWLSFPEVLLLFLVIYCKLKSCLGKCPSQWSCPIFPTAEQSCSPIATPPKPVDLFPSFYICRYRNFLQENLPGPFNHREWKASWEKKSLTDTVRCYSTNVSGQKFSRIKI